MLNETPTMLVAVLTILNVDKDTSDSIVQFIQGVFGFILWLLVRTNINGPVTLYKGRKDDVES